MNVTISIHGWDWAWLLVDVGLAAFVWGFFASTGRELYRSIRKR